MIFTASIAAGRIQTWWRKFIEKTSGVDKLNKQTSTLSGRPLDFSVFLTTEKLYDNAVDTSNEHLKFTLQSINSFCECELPTFKRDFDL